MGKLSKLTNSFSLSDINFSGFSVSKKWTGHFEINKKFAFSLVDEAISLFEDFFSTDDEIIIIIALSFDDSREDDSEILKKYQALYKKIRTKKLLSPMTDSFEKYLYGESSLPASCLNFSFSRDDFLDLSRLIMCHAGVIGQVCFYINPSLNIAIYPHDDIGFGCIALNDDNKACLDFLNHCSTNENFNVCINDEN
ncbi:hypothetical protein LZ633_21430 [Enterobacter asburiae]|nr:hypothetical protein [Enterobacter asburiae]